MIELGHLLLLYQGSLAVGAILCRLGIHLVTRRRPRPIADINPTTGERTDVHP